MPESPSLWFNLVTWLAGILVGIVAWIARTTAARIDREQYSMKNDIRTHSEAVATLMAKDEMYAALPALVMLQGQQIAGINSDLNSIKSSLSRIESRIDRALDGTGGRQ